ncbi:MAG: DNA-binding protein [Xanthomonadaceae bacterium]|nr:DNA-binding protein [Xanthomonadaceae bacterium]
MSLDNLVGISLDRVEANAATIKRLLQAAARNLADAQVTDISAELRFDAAYKAILQLANAALQAHGYRTLTSKPGHHMTMLQTLGMTLDIDRDTVIVLDALRKQRNVVDYSGDLVSEQLVNECCQQAAAVQQAMFDWLRQHHPAWLE